MLTLAAATPLPLHSSFVPRSQSSSRWDGRRQCPSLKFVRNALYWNTCPRVLSCVLLAVVPLLQVTEQAQTGELGQGAVLEGGDSDAERRAAFLELCLALAGGLDAEGLETLYKAARPGIQARLN